MKKRISQKGYLKKPKTQTWKGKTINKHDCLYPSLKEKKERKGLIDNFLNK